MEFWAPSFLLFGFRWVVPLFSIVGPCNAHAGRVPVSLRGAGPILLLVPGCLPERQLIATGGEESLLHAPTGLLAGVARHPVEQAPAPLRELGEIWRGVGLDPGDVAVIGRSRPGSQTSPDL